MQAKGLTSRNWGTRKGDELRQTARGHGKTPEHPERAAKHPERYPDYTGNIDTLRKRVIARKERLFSTNSNFSNFKYNAKRSENAVDKYWNPEQMRAFLRMTVDQVLAIDWADQKRRDYAEFGFLFYH